MDVVYQTAFRFPVVVFSGLLSLAALYWLLVALRLVPVALFEHDSLKNDHLASTMVSLGFAGVPVSFALTVLLILAGGITLAVELVVLRWLPLGLFRVPLGVAVLWVSVAIASPVAASLCQALHHWFHRHASGRCLLGETVVVTQAPDDDGCALAAISDDPQYEVRLHGKPDAMPAVGERRVLVKYLPDEGAYRSVAEQDYLDARTRLSRLRVKGKGGGRSRNGGSTASSGNGGR